uniref:Uncharacterized protein n=1 Tax=Agrobacterium albertimagni TaxID=147266 RepID=A0A7C1SXH9_9HYPH
MKKDLHIDLDEDQGAGAVISSGASTDVIDEGGTKAVIIDEDGPETDKLPEHAIRNDDGSVTLPLFEPVSITTKKDGKVRERTFESLTFHRLKGADIQAIGAASKESETVVTFARSTRTLQALMNAVFEKMDAADIVDSGRVINHFLTSGRRTGR